MKENKETLIKLIFIIVLSVVLLVLILVILHNIKIKDNLGNRVEQENHVSEVVDDIMKNKDKVVEYLKSNNLKKITIYDLKDKLNINISKFSKLSYNCKSETSYIEFNDDYSDYTTVLDCEEFYEEKNE